MVTTFLVRDPKRKKSHPISNILYTAKILDDRRLGKQRVEAMQIIDAIEKDGKGWKNHPATAAWRYRPIERLSDTGLDIADSVPTEINESIQKAYLPALKLYHDIMIREWVDRGKNNNMEVFYTDEEYQSFIKGMWKNSIPFPEWCSIDSVQYSHATRLIQKDPGHYTPIFIDLPNEYLDYGYIWPAKWTLEQLRIPVLADREEYSLLLRSRLDEIAEPFVDYPICIAEKNRRGRCKNKATRGEYCGVHGSSIEVDICTGEFKNGEPCTFRARFGDRCGRHR